MVLPNLIVSSLMPAPATHLDRIRYEHEEHPIINHQTD